MTKLELLKMLEAWPHEADVKIFDADSGKPEDVTGVLYSPNGNAGVLTLQSDDIS